MPYTVSHAIVALPVSKLSKGKIPVAATVIGSVSPDIPYFLAMTPTHAPGHSVMGVLYYCLVPSLLITYIWFNWIERPTLEFWKLIHVKDLRKKNSIPLLFVGILIGAYSHVLWDAASHSYGAIVRQYPILESEILSRPIYKWNQYLSGLFGLAGLMLWYLIGLNNNKKMEYKGNFRLGVIIYFLSIAFFILLGLIYHQFNALVDVLVTSSIAIVNGLILGACIYAILTKKVAER